MMKNNKFFLNINVVSSPHFIFKNTLHFFFFIIINKERRVNIMKTYLKFLIIKKVRRRRRE